MVSSVSSYNLSYETLINAIIRPPRAKYNPDTLSPPLFEYKNKEYSRTDFTLPNKNNYLLQCSFIQPLDSFRPSKTMPVVIYLHGNSSSREEGMQYVPLLLKHNINAFIFDFAGSGLSEGEYISLGYNEKDDLEIVINFLSNQPGVGRIGVWGRSMGAATAMMYIYKDNRIKASIIDSAFGDFKVLAKQLCKKVKNVPEFLVDVVYYFVKGSIKDRCKLDLDTLRPVDYAKLCQSPAMFIHAYLDDLIPLEHTVKMFEEYNGEKLLNVCEGDHHTKRNKDVMDKIAKFLVKHLWGSESEVNENNAQFHKNKRNSHRLYNSDNIHLKKSMTYNNNYKK